MKIFSLTDLVLTGEAIRRKDWDVLAYNGFRRNFRKFLASDKQTYLAYENAVMDTELSWYAKEEGWSNFEFLRLKNKTRRKNPIKLKEIKKMYSVPQFPIINNIKRKYQKIKNKINNKNKLKNSEEKSIELPF